MLMQEFRATRGDEHLIAMTITLRSVNRNIAELRLILFVQ